MDVRMRMRIRKFILLLNSPCTELQKYGLWIYNIFRMGGAGARGGWLGSAQHWWNTVLTLCHNSVHMFCVSQFLKHFNDGYLLMRFSVLKVQSYVAKNISIRIRKQALISDSALANINKSASAPPCTVIFSNLPKKMRHKHRVWRCPRLLRRHGGGEQRCLYGRKGREEVSWWRSETFALNFHSFKQMQTKCREECLTNATPNKRGDGNDKAMNRQKRTK